MIREAIKIQQDDVGHIPLHQQALAWAMKKNVDLVQLADNYMPLKWVTIREGGAPTERRRPAGSGMNAVGRVWDSDVAYSFRSSPVAVSRRHCVHPDLLRCVCTLGRAVQPVRSGDDQSARRVVAAGLGRGRQSDFWLGTDDQGRDYSRR